MHARPAGLLVKEAKKYDSKIVIKKETKTVEATKLIAIMGLGVKCGQDVEVEISGSDEITAYKELKAFFEVHQMMLEDIFFQRFVVKMWSNQENRVRKRMLRHAQLGKEFPRCRAVALYISIKKPSLSRKLERGLFT